MLLFLSHTPAPLFPDSLFQFVGGTAGVSQHRKGMNSVTLCEVLEWGDPVVINRTDD
jgi:hypothetical protein